MDQDFKSLNVVLIFVIFSKDVIPLLINYLIHDERFSFKGFTCSAPLYISYLIGQVPNVGVALIKYVYLKFTLGD